MILQSLLLKMKKRLLIDKYDFDEHHIEKMIKFLRIKYNQFDKSYKKIQVDPFI